MRTYAVDSSLEPAVASALAADTLGVSQVGRLRPEAQPEGLEDWMVGWLDGWMVG